MKKIPQFFSFLALPAMALLMTLFFSHCGSDRGTAKRVFLIGIDGMGVSGFQQARTPHLDALVRMGALSLKTRSVMPSVSGPNWGSHLLGAGPEQHGITYNGWTMDNHTLDPVITDADGYFPSLFNVIRDQMPKAKTAFFYDWNALADLYNVSLIDQVEFSKGYEATLDKAVPWIIENKPDFTFLYFGHPDEVGHAHQWGSKDYIKALEDVDSALGAFFDALREAGMFKDSHFIVVSDHGGQGYGHGGLSMEEMQTPWIIAGPGIITNRLIGQPNDVMNTAATIAYLFQLEVPYAWTGRPVLGALEHHPLAKENVTAYVPQPFPSISSGMYTESDGVEFTVSDPKVKVRFTVDGSDPGTQSPVYKSPILLQKSTTLKAAGSLDGEMSMITLVNFVKVLEASSIKLADQPDEKYPGNGAPSLVDRQTGSGQFNDGKWLGFRGADLDAFITLQDRADVSRVSLGFMNNPGSWIFPPQNIQVLASVDGNSFSEIGSIQADEISGQLVKGRNEIAVKIKPALTKYIKVVVKNMGNCPPDHPGAGEPAWLFVDEIILE